MHPPPSSPLQNLPETTVNSTENSSSASSSSSTSSLSSSSSSFSSSIQLPTSAHLIVDAHSDFLLPPDWSELISPPVQLLSSDPLPLPSAPPSSIADRSHSIVETASAWAILLQQHNINEQIAKRWKEELEDAKARQELLQMEKKWQEKIRDYWMKNRKETNESSTNSDLRQVHDLAPFTSPALPSNSAVSFSSSHSSHNQVSCADDNANSHYAIESIHEVDRVALRDQFAELDSHTRDRHRLSWMLLRVKFNHIRKKRLKDELVQVAFDLESEWKYEVTEHQQTHSQADVMNQRREQMEMWTKTLEKRIR